MDLATLIVDLLRKKQDAAAVHAGEGQMSPEQLEALLRAQSTPMQPQPGMLGNGAAQRAGSLIQQQQAAPMNAVDAAQR